MSRAYVGGSGSLEASDHSASSGDDGAARAGVSLVIGGDSEGDGEASLSDSTLRLDVDVEAWTVYDQQLAQGARLAQLDIGLSSAGSWSESSVLTDGRSSLGVGIFLNETSLGRRSVTDVSWSGGGLYVSGEYEWRLGAGPSWGLTGFVQGRGQLGVAEADGDALGGNSYDLVLQHGFGGQVGLRYTWSHFFAQAGYVLRNVELADASPADAGFGGDLGGPSVDFTGGMLTFGLRW